MIPGSRILILAALLVNIFHDSVAPPVTQKHQPDETNDIMDNIGIEYKRYLEEVVQALESDQEFRAKLEKAEDADLRSGKIAQELEYVRHDVRTKLDELKRAELERLRHYIRRQAELKQGLDPDHIKKVKDQSGHIDHSNPHTFEIADLEKLIAKTTQHLAEADKKRREEFKQYEMQKEFERNQERKNLNQVEREKFDKKLRDQQDSMRHRQPQLHHPGSKKQLEEVWQYQDNMNVKDFDPKTFFYMHDVDGNGFLDQEEVKALFLRELQKLYSLGYPGEDLRERTEEMERMREHVFVEADVNRDGVISLQEWLDLTRRPDFNADPGWDLLEPKKEYTEDEYRQFEHQRQQEIEALIAQGKLKMGYEPNHVQPGYHPNVPGQPNPQQHSGQPGVPPHPQFQQQQQFQQAPGHPQPGYQQPHQFQQQQHPQQQVHDQQQGHPPDAYQQQPQAYQQQPPVHQQQPLSHQQQPVAHQQQAQDHHQQPPAHQQPQAHQQLPASHEQQQQQPHDQQAHPQQYQQQQHQQGSAQQKGVAQQQPMDNNIHH